MHDYNTPKRVKYELARIFEARICYASYNTTKRVKYALVRIFAHGNIIYPYRTS